MVNFRSYLPMKDRMDLKASGTAMSMWAGVLRASATVGLNYYPNISSDDTSSG